MIDRYTTPEMGVLWSLFTKFKYWLKVELAIIKAKWLLDMIDENSIRETYAKADYTVERVEELDQTFNHDLIAFVETVKETLRTKGVGEKIIGLFHKDVTSYDIEDSAFVLQIQAGCKILLETLRSLRKIIFRRAKEFKHTPAMGITHGQAAEVITLGIKLLNYVDICDRDIERLDRAMRDFRVGRLAGAVGNYGHLGPEMEKMVCRELGLRPARMSTQILHRDLHAEVFSKFTIIAGNIEHIANNLWLMCSFPRMEAREGFKQGQRGSSQMPHKRNPHKIERLRGMASAMRGYNVSIMEMISTYDERSIDQSSVERIAWADGTTLLHFMLESLTKVVETMEFFPDQMDQNIQKTLGLVSSGFVKDALLEKGVTEHNYGKETQPTYVFVQSCSFEAWERKVQLDQVLIEHDILKELTKDELANCFDYNRFLKYVDEKFAEFES